MMAEFFIMLVACGFALMGVGALWRPLLVTRQFDISELSRAGRSETRAVYGGFGLLMAVVLAMSIVNPDIRSGVCLTIAAALGGMALGRILSMISDQGIDRAPLFYLILEAVLAVTLLVAA